jgi:anti-sigma-K factor RskA
MSATGHIQQDDLTLFAMQLLSADEAAVIAEHVEQCAECRREVASLRGDLAAYALSVDLHSPPALARERLMKQVAREKKFVPVSHAAHTAAPVEAPFRPSSTFLGSASSYHEEEEPPRRSFASKVLPWAGWAIAAGLAVAAAGFYQERNALKTTVASQSSQLANLTANAAAARQLLDTMNDSAAMRVTLQKPLTAPVPQGKATYVADKGALIFTASNLDPLLPYKVYELWLIPADGRDPIPAGTFRPDDHGNANVIMPTLPKGVPAKMFGVTVEDQGGSTTPTLPIILAGTAT